MTSARHLALVSAILVTAAACGASPAPPPPTVVSAPAPPPSASARAGEAKEDPASTGKAVARASDLEALDKAMVEALNEKPAARGDGVVVGVLDGAQGGTGVGVGGSSGLHLGEGGLKPVGGGTSPGGPAGGGGKVKGPIAAVTIGIAALSGGSISNSAQVVAGMAAGFRRCLNKALQEEPPGVKEGGRMEVTAKIHKDGEVISASPSSVSGLSPRAVACILARVSSAQFAPPDGGSATLMFPVTAHVLE